MAGPRFYRHPWLATTIVEFPDGTRSRRIDMVRLKYMPKGVETMKQAEDQSYVQNSRVWTEKGWINVENYFAVYKP